MQFDGLDFPSILPRKIPPVAEKNRKRVIVISGPTATGKTELSINLALKLGGEIVSADSMQVYKGMDIGTSKVTREETKNVPHYLLDIRDVSKIYNVSEFYHDAISCIRSIIARGKVPIVVGGTGFYLRALINGPPSGPPSSKEIRDQLERDIERFGTEKLYERLFDADPEYASSITSGDKQKIVRGLEILLLTGKKVSDFPKLHENMAAPEFEFQCYFLYYPREILYPRIELRCDLMVKKGFPEEVEKLLVSGLKENTSASNAIGYRQYIEYLDSEQTDADWDEFVWSFKQATRRYAKRQFTWFRKEKDFTWLNLEDVSDPLEIILRSS